MIRQPKQELLNRLTVKTLGRNRHPSSISRIHQSATTKHASKKGRRFYPAALLSEIEGLMRSQARPPM
jgi:hypothetical protein